MQGIKKMEKAKLLGKQESPEIDSLSDTDEEAAAAAPPSDTKATVRKMLQNEVAQNIKAEDPLSNEENVKNQLAMSDPSNSLTKGEDEEELNAAKAMLQDEEVVPLLEDEEVAQSQTEEDATNTQEQQEPTDTQEQVEPADTQEQLEPTNTQEQPEAGDTDEQLEPTDTHKQPEPAEIQEDPVPMETNETHINIPDDNSDEEVLKEEAPESKIPREQLIAKDYYYRCRSCNQVLDNLRGLVEHRMAKHDIQPRPHLFTHMDLEPIVSDPDHYCRSCDMYFISRMRYRDHLENAHHMVLKPLRRPTYAIDEDPNLYCEPCDKYLRNKYMYRYHLQKHHNADLPPLKRKANPDITPDLDNPDFYCASCEYKFKKKGAFKTHCEKIHKMQVPKKSRIVKEGTPELNDPDNYCKVCEHTFSTRQKYKRHCRNVHKMDDPALRPPMLRRVSTPKFFCKTCGVPLYKDSYYLRHLSLTHTVDVISLHHDEDDTESRADIIELIHARKAEIGESESTVVDQSRPQIVTIDVESADTEAIPSESTAAKSTKNRPRSAVVVIQNPTESVSVPKERMRLRSRPTKHVRFVGLPDDIDDTSAGSDDDYLLTEVED